MLNHLFLSNADSNKYRGKAMIMTMSDPSCLDAASAYLPTLPRQAQRPAPINVNPVVTNATKITVDHHGHVAELSPCFTHTTNGCIANTKPSVTRKHRS